MTHRLGARLSVFSSDPVWRALKLKDFYPDIRESGQQSGFILCERHTTLGDRYASP